MGRAMSFAGKQNHTQHRGHKKVEDVIFFCGVCDVIKHINFFLKLVNDFQLL